MSCFFKSIQSLILLTLVCSTLEVEAETDSSRPLKVLVYSPHFGSSHSKFMGSLADTLTDAGHDVTYLVPVAGASAEHHLGVYTTKKVMLIEEDNVMETKNITMDTSFAWMIDMANPDFEKMFSSFTTLMLETCSNLLRTPGILEKMRSEQFDVAIAEPLFVCPLAFFEAIGVKKTILSTSCTMYDHVLPHIGEPQDLSYVPSNTASEGDVMNIWERYHNYRMAESSRASIEKSFDKELELCRNVIGPKIPDWKDLFASASLYFTNSNPYLDFPRPVIQKTVPIGGISVDIEKIKSAKLSEEWEEVLNRRPRTMLISFGSMAKSREMPVNYRSNLLAAIRSEPDVTFIWKYESENVAFADGVPNVYFSKWVPQTALLADRRLTAFLTHGGLGSTVELSYCGTPAIMVPLSFDQTRNSNMLVRHKTAILVRRPKLADLDVLKTAFHTILHDESYQKNAKRLAEMLSDQPHTPKELLVRNTEFVAKYGPFPQMDPYSRQLNFYQKNLLDIFGLMFTFGFIVVLGVLIVFRTVFLKLRSSKVEQTKQEVKKDL